MLLQSAAKNEIPFRDALLDSPADFPPPLQTKCCVAAKDNINCRFLENALPDGLKLIEICFLFIFYSQRKWMSFDLYSYFQILQKLRFSICAFLLHTVWLTVIYNILIWGTLISRCKTISNQHLYFFPSPFLPQFWINLVERNGKKTWISA